MFSEEKREGSLGVHLNKEKNAYFQLMNEWAAIVLDQG